MTSPVHNSGACHTRAPASRPPTENFMPELQKALNDHRAASPKPAPERLPVSSSERYEPLGENLKISWSLPGATKQAGGPDGPDVPDDPGAAEGPNAPRPPDDSDPDSTPEVPDSATWRPRGIDEMTAHARESGSFRFDPASTDLDPDREL